MLAEKDARRRKQERGKQRVGNIQKKQKKGALFQTSFVTENSAKASD